MRWPLLLLLCAAACSRPRAASGGDVPADIAMQGVTMRQFRGNQTHLALTATHAAMQRDTGAFSMADASVRLEAQGLTIHAPRVTGNLNTQVLEGEGGLTFTTADGITGRTDHATLDRSLGPEGGAVSDAGISLVHRDFTLEAQGFAADFATSSARFEQPVTQAGGRLAAEQLAAPSRNPR